VTVKPIKVVGLEHAMAELAGIDKRALKQFQMDYKKIVLPMLQEANYLVPVKAPMSGWNRSWTPRSYNRDFIANRQDLFPWSESKSGRQKIKPYINRHRARRYTSGNSSSSVAFGIRWNDPQGMLFDMLGKGSPKTQSGNRMMDVVGQRYGAPSRVMWRAYERAGDDVQREMVKLINGIMKATGRNIRTRRR
jgi:hypothetical protein